RLRTVDALLAVGCVPARVRLVRRRLDGAAHDDHAAGHPGRDAWPGVVDQRTVRRIVERAGRVVCRLDGAPARAGACRRAGWLRPPGGRGGDGKKGAATSAP